MLSDKVRNKQWCDIWIEKDGFHLLKIAYESLFKNKNGDIDAPNYIKDDYIIKFENVKKIEKMYYKDRRVMLVSLYDTNVQFEVTVRDYLDYRILKSNLLTKTVGTKRKFALAATITIILVLLSNVNYTTLFKNLLESVKYVDLGNVDMNKLSNM